ncbi:MAG TPA: sugar ABC transporter permease [Anaerolineales bacterium]|nr:sugar ABC transporter permease [Anaerolineales bacterium]
MENLSMHVEDQSKKKVRLSGSSRSRNRRTIDAYAFLLPYILFMLAFGLGPGIYAFLISFADFSSGLPRYFAAGINNYLTVFKDSRFGFTFANIGEFLLISVPVGIALVVLLTLLLHMRPGPVSSTLRTLFFVPGAAVGPAVVLLVIFMLTPNLSPFGFLLKSIGFKAFNDIITPASLPFIFLIMGFFVGAGMWIAIQYGALEGISNEVMEAATIDGCNEWQKALYIKLPLIQPYIVYQFILIFAGNVQLFVEPQLLGNQTYIHANVPLVWSPNQLAYSFAFDLGNFGASAALALIMLLIGLGASYLMIRWTGFFKIEN